jgi:hypothetical protein
MRRKMGRRPRAAGPVCHAVGTHLERVVRPHCAGAPAALWHKRRETEDFLLLRSEAMAQLHAVRPVLAAVAVLGKPLTAGRRRHQELEKNAAGSDAWLRRGTHLLWGLCSRSSAVCTARRRPDLLPRAAVFLRGTRLTLLLRPTPSGALPDEQQHGLFLCGLTFELSGCQRQDARPGLVKMYRVPPARAWWPAVGAPLERGVRPHSAGA